MKYATKTEIANVAGVAPSAVSNWLKRDVGFPEPAIVSISGRCQLWDIEKVQAWLVSRESVDRAWMKEYI